MRLNCPECKNDVDLTNCGEIHMDQIVECDKCGISLLVNEVDGDIASAEVADEGK